MQLTSFSNLLGLDDQRAKTLAETPHSNTARHVRLLGFVLNAADPGRVGDNKSSAF